jgi:hypothetical protein
MFNRVSRNTSFLMRGIGVACLALLSACALFSKQATADLTEKNLNELISASPARAGDPFRITGVDMKDGFLRVSMAYRKSDGTEIAGSYDLALKTDKGQVIGEIQRVDMPGLELDAQTTRQIADLISRDFVNLAADQNQLVEFKDITINEDSIKMTMRIK